MRAPVDRFACLSLFLPVRLRHVGFSGNPRHDCAPIASRWTGAHPSYFANDRARGLSVAGTVAPQGAPSAMRAIPQFPYRHRGQAGKGGQRQRWFHTRQAVRKFALAWVAILSKILSTGKKMKPRFKVPLLWCKGRQDRCSRVRPQQRPSQILLLHG